MSSRLFRITRVLGSGGFLVFLAFSSNSQYTNGIYAEFNTSLGSITCRLEYATAPKACANFIGLATGQRPRLDLPSGRTKSEPLYNGTLFHRVVPGFMIQGGSPNGQGTDGPGYTFVDEFSPSLRHDRFGTLSMANTGPDANGCQYFITAAPTSYLDDMHTIFGRLYGGSNVVYAINHVATDANERPLTNVVVQSVEIRRIGTDAEAFNLFAHGLPTVTNLPLTIARSGTNMTITFSNKLNVDNRFYVSTNLAQWSATKLGIVVVGPPPGGVLVNTIQPTRFFHMAQIQYPDTLFVPFNVLGRTVTLNLTGVGTLTIAFNSSGGGTYTWSAGLPGNVVSYSWIQDPYRGRLSPILFTAIPPMALHLDFDTGASGTFKGTVYPNYPSSIGSSFVYGTFTASP